MRRKVAWLTLWMTLAFWVGCAQRPLSQLPPDYQELIVVERPDVSVLSEPDPSPSVTGIERNWDPIVVKPGRGYVLHWPAYFKSDFQAQPVLTFGGDMQSVAESVTMADRGLQRGDVSTTFWQTLDFAADLALAPVRIAQRPPWTTAYSPNAD